MTVQFLPEPEPTPEERVRRARYRELENTLTYIGLAEFEYERDECRAARLWMQDARRSLGALALLLADGPDAEGYARLLDGILTPPQTIQEQAYIERQANDARES